jgi:hypothetical protein
MDINYTRGREQATLRNASTALSSPQRLAQESFAEAHRGLLDDTTFRHRRPVTTAVRQTSIRVEPE